jgi:hypothetical protein
MLNDRSGLVRIDPGVDNLFENYNFTLVTHWPVSNLPVQRCGDKKYIPDDTILDYYRNLDYRMINHTDYSSKVIGGMVRLSCWMVTSLCESGVRSPINMFVDYRGQASLHPGKKRYIVANYLGLDTVPVMVQQFKTQPRIAGRPIYNTTQLVNAYDNNVSIKVNYKKKLECSWHGATNHRDKNGYDDWWKTSNLAINKNNKILDYVLQHGLHINCASQLHSTSAQNGIFNTHVNHNATDHDFYLEVDNTIMLEKDLWQLYFHFDPRVGVKSCSYTGIKIINNLGDPAWTMQVNLANTLNRVWIPCPKDSAT